jgi:hypothetical protein
MESKSGVSVPVLELVELLEELREEIGCPLASRPSPLPPQSASDAAAMAAIAAKTARPDIARVDMLG